MKFEDVFNLCNDKHELIGFLQHYKLLLADKQCPKCKIKCNLNEIGGKVTFKCSKCSSRFTSAPKNSFLYRIRLTYGSLLQIIYSFVNNIKLTEASSLLKIRKATLVDYYRLCREVCEIEIINSSEKIGGVGKTVEVVENVFSQRKYLTINTKYHWILKSKWVIGGIERGSDKCFLVPVEKRDSKTLTAVLKANILPETKVITGEWEGYAELEKLDLIHLKVNHSLHFVDPVTRRRIHTNIIEGELAKMKLKIPKREKSKEDFVGYLCTAMWFRKVEPEDRFHAFIEAIGRHFYEKDGGGGQSTSGEEKKKRKRKSSGGSSKVEGKSTAQKRIEAEGWELVDSDVTPSDISQTSDGIENAESNPKRPLGSSSDSVTEFDLFGKSVAYRLNKMPRNTASHLRLKILEVISTFRHQMSVRKPDNSPSREAPPPLGDNFVDVKMEIKEETI